VSSEPAEHPLAALLNGAIVILIAAKDLLCGEKQILRSLRSLRMMGGLPADRSSLIAARSGSLTAHHPPLTASVTHRCSEARR
jgi:hypothetical protein